MSTIRSIVNRINLLRASVYIVGVRVNRLQAQCATAFFRLDRLRSAQSFAYENGHRWPGPEPKELEEAKVVYRDAKLDLEAAQREQARFLGELGEAQAELQEAERDAKRDARNKPLTTRPFSALLG